MTTADAFSRFSVGMMQAFLGNYHVSSCFLIPDAIGETQAQRTAGAMDTAARSFFPE
jgi:hypothetical protein